MLPTADLMLAHREDAAAALGQNAHKVLRPDQLAFTSYPYEWAFDQLRDAALAMLEIQQRALNAGMSLKDASAYNMQLHDARPRLIDTLSFELLDERYPWVAYRQFCEHFLAPLALMAYVDVHLGRLLQSHLNGIPLPLAARLMPFRTRLRPGLAIHLHLHARAQRRAESRLADRASFRGRMNLRRLHAVVGSLKSTVGKLHWDPQATRWLATRRPAATGARRPLTRPGSYPSFSTCANPGRFGTWARTRATTAGSPRRAARS